LNEYSTFKKGAIMPLNTALDESGTSTLFTRTRQTITFLMGLNKVIDAETESLRLIIEQEGNPMLKQGYVANLGLLTDLQKEVLNSVDIAIKISMSPQHRLVSVISQKK
jgi:hypothetical protein